MHKCCTLLSSFKKMMVFISPVVDLLAVSGARGGIVGNTGKVLGNFLATLVFFRPNSTLMEVKVHSSTSKLVPSDVDRWFRFEGSAIRE